METDGVPAVAIGVSHRWLVMRTKNQHSYYSKLQLRRRRDRIPKHAAMGAATSRPQYEHLMHRWNHALTAYRMPPRRSLVGSSWPLFHKNKTVRQRFLLSYQVYRLRGLSHHPWLFSKYI